MALTDGSPEPPRPRRSPLQALLPYTTIVLIIAALYVAWVFYSRYESNKRAEQALAAKEEAQRKRVIDEVYGSGEIRFQNFSADNGSLRRGETTELCYGVENATSVKLDPPVEAIKPMYHHCIEVAPKKTTTYTITAFDAKGNHKSLSLTIQVR